MRHLEIFPTQVQKFGLSTPPTCNPPFKMLRNIFKSLPKSISSSTRGLATQNSGKTVGHEPIAPSAIDSAAHFLFFTEIARGMAIAHEQIFRQPYTIMYPFEKGPLSPRFRGEHALRRYPTGMY